VGPSTVCGNGAASSAAETAKIMPLINCEVKLTESFYSFSSLVMLAGQD
jgi:hypothetical protein